MTPAEVRNEVAMAALTGEWSAELTDAVSAVAWEAATNPLARAAVELWIRAGAAELITHGQGNFELWFLQIDLFLHMRRRDNLLPGAEESIRSSLAAVVVFLDV